MAYFTLNNIDIQFADKKLVWKTYIVVEALSTIRMMELINKKDFATVPLGKDVEACVVYMISLILELIIIHLAWETRIVFLLMKEIILLTAYADFTNVFLKKLVEVLPEKTSVNEYAIELLDGKQLLNEAI